MKPLSRVLVIDDDRDICEALVAVLKEEFSVDFAQDGAGALQRLAADPGYDVIICDCRMPGMTGPELYQRVTSEWPGLEKRFLFLTGGGVTEDCEAFLAGMRARVLRKPISLRRLRTLVQELIRELNGAG